jgi:hypothetical protein
MQDFTRCHYAIYILRSSVYLRGLKKESGNQISLELSLRYCVSDQSGPIEFKKAGYFW